MADQNTKENTPPPLLLMSASEGLTLTPTQGSSLLMPIPQTGTSLIPSGTSNSSVTSTEPSGLPFGADEEGESDSFIGQGQNEQQAAHFSYFQQTPAGGSSDPFSQLTQPDMSQLGPPHLPPAQPQVSFNQGTPAFSQSQPAISQAHPAWNQAYPAASMEQTIPSRPPGAMSFNPGGPPPRGSAPPAGPSQNFHRQGVSRYAQPPPGTYATPYGQPTFPPQPPPSTIGAAQNDFPPSSVAPPPSHHAPPPAGQSDFHPPPPAAHGGSSAYHSPSALGPYIPVQHHWFYSKNIGLRQMWLPFSIIDSTRLEEAFRAGVPDGTMIGTDGARYDVDINNRNRSSIFWEELPTVVRRCSWFFKPEGESRFVPYEEDFALKLEEEYKNALINNVWHKRLEFPGGETIVMHNPNVIVHFRPSSQPDEWGTTQGEQLRPRVVRRGVEDSDNISEGEPLKVDHLVFVVHGIGSTCDLRFRNIVECVDDFRAISLQMLRSHFKQYQDEERIGRVEFLPVRWHAALHGDATGVDSKLKAITLNSIGKLRHFTNDTLLDILFYASPTYAQKIADTVGCEINNLFNLFLTRNPGFQGGVSIAGHSLGSLILFDLLSHQLVPGTATERQSEKLPLESTVQEPEIADTPETTEVNGEAGQEDPDENLTVEQLLEKLSLMDYIGTFQKEQIDMETLTMCEESDIKEMGIPLGPRKKLQGFIKDRKLKQKKKQEDVEKRAKLEIEKKLRAEYEKKIEEANQQEMENAAAHDPLLRAASNTSVNFVVGQMGTGLPQVKYPQLEFVPANFFALGSPIAMFLTVRGVELLGDDFHLPTCTGFFNIFHPFDPVAYRIEPMIVQSFPAKPVLMPHHKGRKRLHLELRDSLTRVGTDLKQKLSEYVRSTWRSLNEFALAHRTTPQEVVDKEVDNVITEMSKEEEDILETSSLSSSQLEEEVSIGNLNQGRRVDYVLQEKPIESFNDYIFALGSHACYWESEDTVLLILKEIYAAMGVAPQKPGQETPRGSPAPAFPPPVLTPQRMGLPPHGVRETPPTLTPSTITTTQVPPVGTAGHTGPVGPPPRSGFLRTSAQ